MARSDMTVELTLTDAAKMLIAEAREQLELNDKERAVIEAAKVLFNEYTAEDQTPDAWHTDTVLDVRLRRLFATVEALLAIEKGET